MKKILFILICIACLSCGTHKFKHKVKDVVYVNTTLFSEHDDSTLTVTIKELSHGSDSLKAKVVRRMWVDAYDHPYYEVEFFDIDGNLISLKGKKGFIYEHITAIPEQMIYDK